MDISFYKILHVIGIMILFQSLGAYLYSAITASSSSDRIGLRMLTRLHGVGLLLILISGGGMLAKSSLFWPLPGWVWIMIAVWILIALPVHFVKKNPSSARMWWSLTLVLGVFAALAGVLKPF